MQAPLNRLLLIRKIVLTLAVASISAAVMSGVIGAWISSQEVVRQSSRRALDLALSVAELVNSGRLSGTALSQPLRRLAEQTGARRIEVLQLSGGEFRVTASSSEDSGLDAAWEVGDEALVHATRSTLSGTTSAHRTQRGTHRSLAPISGGVVSVELLTPYFDWMGESVWLAVLSALVVSVVVVTASGALSRRLARSFSRAHESLEGAATQIALQSGRVSESSNLQNDSLTEVSASVQHMQSSNNGIAANVENLSSFSEQTSSSVLEMVASIDEVAGHTEGLAQAMQETSATTEQMAAAIREIDRNTEALSKFISETSGAMLEMDGAIQQVEHSAQQSDALSEQAGFNAEQGMRAVEKTIEGMIRIKKAVQSSAEVIGALGEHSQEVGSILSVIDEVAEQTNLLALNAAIIAAQAGEHGKGFAVVAEEIRKLAERTASSTKEIGSLISTFQSDTARAIEAMKEGSRTVEEGSSLSMEAGRSLGDILSSTQKSSAMVREIVRSAKEQSRASQSVAAAVGKVREMVEQINKATSEQSAGAEQIRTAVENMREITGHVKRATVEQSKGSKLITQAIENVTTMVNQIDEKFLEHSKGTEQVVSSLERLRSATTSNLESVESMREVTRLLREQTQQLQRESEGIGSH